MEFEPFSMRNEAEGRLFFPPLERVQIERMACTDPTVYGLEITRWDTRTLARVVMSRAVVDRIHYTTVAHILAEASLQPHRFRYWKTARLDAEFTRRAARVLWCYEQVGRLHRQGEAVICLDEKPNIQALSRIAPTQPGRPGSIARLEFEYRRHGTVTLLVAFNVFDGRMWACCLEANDHEHFLDALDRIGHRWRQARKIHLILDNGSSHIDHHTTQYLTAHSRFRPVFTPAGSIKPNCCCVPTRTSIWIALKPLRAVI